MEISESTFRNWPAHNVEPLLLVRGNQLIQGKRYGAGGHVRTAALSSTNGETALNPSNLAKWPNPSFNSDPTASVELILQSSRFLGSTQPPAGCWAG